MKIIIRDDDVIISSKKHSAPLDEFIKVHELALKYAAIHHPAILCGDIQRFPATIEYIRHKTQVREMIPQLHGWNHVDYGKMNPNELRDNFRQCIDWMQDNFWVKPAIFYPPWNAWSQRIEDIAKEFDMVVHGCNVEKIEPWYIPREPAKYVNRDEVEILMHWWWGATRLEPALKVLRNV